jgi:predicted dienelactone hydrolase
MRPVRTLLSSPLTRRRLLAASALGGALGALALTTGCTVRARVVDETGSAFSNGRRSEQPGLRIARDGFAFVEADWIDPARQRAVPVRLYLPFDVSGPAPLVLFSHGLGGSRRGYSYLGSHFARQGVASLHVQHVGSDRALWGGSPFELASRMQASVQEAEAVDRVADLRFALDRLLALPTDDPLYLAIDPRRIVVAGHSYGANTALLASGASVEREGRAVDLRDPRIRAAILLSAPPFYGENALDAILRPVTLPTLHVTATGDDIRVPGYFSSVQDRIAVFEATGSALKALAVFEGGSHSIFTDRPGTGGAELNPRVKAATQSLSMAFLALVFEGRDEPMRTWRSTHAGIVARFARQPALA